MDFQGFVGGTYDAAASLQDNQKSINYYVEIDPNTDAKTPNALLSAPGLIDLGQSVYAGEVRGMWVLYNGKAIVVVGSIVLLMAIVSNPGNVRPTFNYTKVGTLVSTSGPVSIRDNGVGHICVIVDGANMYVYNTITGSFVVSTDPAFLGSLLVCEIDGWFVFQQPGTQKFYTSPLYWDGSSPFDGTYFSLKDDAHDPCVSMIEQNRELWLIGSETTEVWYNAGGNYFPFSRLQGTLVQMGCAAPYSVERYDAGFLLLARSERGNLSVMTSAGYGVKTVSNPAMEYQINQYPLVYDARAYVYTEEGHSFYVLTFPTANVTWVLDMTTGQWHNRASFDPDTGVFNRQRANCTMHFGNMIIVGDYVTGQVYWQTRSAYTDGNYPLVSVRRAPHIWDKSDRNRVRHNRLQLEFKPGSAAQTGSFTDPQAVLTWSDDGGQTFGNEHFAPIGMSGETKNRCIWRRLGIARDRVYEVRISDPVNRDIVGASIQGEPLRS